MAQKFDIRQLFFDVFGIAITPPIEVQGAAAKPRNSKLGAPYYASQSNKFGGREWFLPVQLGDVQLPLPHLTIEASRNIRKRKLKAADGDLKANLGANDFEITVRGVCTGEYGIWPEDEVALLYKLHSEGKTLPINNVHTAIAGIEKVVINRVRVFENNGYEGVVPYQMELTSDREYNLIVKDV